VILPLVTLRDLLGNIGSYQAMINKRSLPGDCRILPNDRLWVVVTEGQGGRHRPDPVIHPNSPSYRFWRKLPSQPRELAR